MREFPEKPCPEIHARAITGATTLIQNFARLNADGLLK
jgi:hypothetical protein